MKMRNMHYSPMLLALALLCASSTATEMINVAKDADIKATSTCGASGPETFCYLADHVASADQNSPAANCKRCTDATTYGIRNAIDESSKDQEWQSATLAKLRSPNQLVTITIDLKQVYQISLIIIQFGMAPRPAVWTLEKSMDNARYSPWMFFSKNCSTFSKPTNTLTETVGDDEVICTADFSSMEPLTDGEASISLINNRRSLVEWSNTERKSGFVPTQRMMNFTLARYIRLRFQRMHTLPSDNLRLASVMQRYFYAIRNIFVGGLCMCNGYSTTCALDELSKTPTCSCTGNTCGSNCEVCCPLYNQLAWQPGSMSIECEKCNCNNHATLCYYNETVARNSLSIDMAGQRRGGGVCKDCRDNTEGVNCERCKRGFYRRAGVSPDSKTPCERCSCRANQQFTGECVRDEQHAALLNLNGLSYTPGDCVCKPGFAGSRCASCAPAYFGYPNCQPCTCNANGTANLETCETGCECKNNVDTSNGKCDTCKTGTFNLDGRNPDGCSPCFCFGLEVPCRSLGQQVYKLWYSQNWSVAPRYWRAQLNKQNFASNEMRLLNAGASRGLYYRTASLQEIQNQMRISNEINDPYFAEAKVFYASAPEAYLGNRVTSYGTKVIFHIRVDASPEAVAMSDESCDLIVQSRTMTLCYRLNNQDFRANEVKQVQIPLDDSTIEGSWTVIENLDASQNELVSDPASKADIMSALVNIDRLLVRTSFFEDQTAFYLESFYMLIASDRPIAGAEYVGNASHAELCECPSGFGGTSCEACAFGYRRVNNVLFGGTCQKCDCNDNAPTCDPFTGECIGYCLNSTSGEYCDECSFNHYAWKEPAKCKPCGCPRNEQSNFFAARCAPAESANSWTCVDCEAGYVGERCERCDEGYYGDPTVINGKCRQCECNGNVNQNEPGWCNNRTGQCARCLYNTAGTRCEKCLDAFYGDARRRNCRQCNCDPIGSRNATCDAAGQCYCKPNYAGEKCDRCQKGRGDFRAGCQQCNCDAAGSANGECSLEDGTCKCRENYEGKKCDKCTSTSYRSGSECRSCGCYERGSRNENCRDGRCTCKTGVRGSKCDQCSPNQKWSTNNTGCTQCNCNSVGSVNPQCDTETGECSCRPNVDTLTNCAKCLPGYYNLTRDGCTQCNPCPSQWHVCNDRTGVCECPPFTTGNECERCQRNTWGYDRDRGCKTCGCSIAGSVSQSCDADTGDCQCRDGFEGQKCDQCATDSFGPNCAKCNCNVNGSVSASCNASGTCSCKPNFVGQKCDQCARDAFMTPTGCVKCFCFGRSSSNNCSATNATVARKSIELQTVDHADDGASLVRIAGVRNAYVIPSGDVANLRTNRAAIYWNLSSVVLGDLVSSYGMKVRIVLQSIQGDGGREVYLPLAKMVAQSNKLPTTLDYAEEIPIINNDNTEVDLILTEFYWRPTFTRERFLLLLQQVDLFYVRAGDSDFLESASIIRGELRHVAHRFDANSKITDDTTALVEKCQCRQGYTGTSCQKTEVGFTLQFVDSGALDSSSNSTDSKIVGAVVGNAIPCFCNGHTGRCDRLTGECINCQHNTIGKYCDMCAYGYHGPTNSTSTTGCQPCECPMTTNNFAESCRRNAGGRFTCVCEAGYTAANCGECAPGYYEVGGGPTVERGKCIRCDCSEMGTVNGSEICDRKTGQCPCKSGIEGRRCDQCGYLSALINGRCETCNTGCEGRLMESLDAINASLSGYRGKVRSNITFPTAYLDNLRRRADAVENCSKTHKAAQTSVKNSLQNLSNRERTTNRGVQDLAQKAAELANGTNQQRHQALIVQQNVTNLNDRVDSFEQLLQTHLRQENDSSQIDTNRILEESKKAVQYLKELQKNATAGVSRIRTQLNGTDAQLNQFLELVGVHQTMVDDLKTLAVKFDGVNEKYLKLSSSVPTTESNLQQARDTLLELDRLYAELQTKTEAANSVLQMLARTRMVVANAVAGNATKVEQNWLLIEKFRNYKNIIDVTLQTMNVTVQNRLIEIREQLQADQLKEYVRRLNSTLVQVSAMFDLKGADASAAALTVREFARQLQEFAAYRNNFTAQKAAFEEDYSKFLREYERIEAFYQNISRLAQNSLDKNASLTDDLRLISVKMNSTIQQIRPQAIRQDVDNLRMSLNQSSTEYNQVKLLAQNNMDSAVCSPKQEIPVLRGKVSGMLWQARLLDNVINEDDQYIQVLNELAAKSENASQQFDILVRDSNEGVAAARRQASVITDRLEKIRQKLSSVRIDVTRFQDETKGRSRSLIRTGLTNRPQAQKSRSYNLESLVEPSPFLRVEMTFSPDAQSVADRGQVLGQLLFDDRVGDSIEQYSLTIGLKNRKVVASCKTGESEIQEVGENEVTAQAWHSLVVERHPAGSILIKLVNVTLPFATSAAFALTSTVSGDASRRTEPKRITLGGSSTDTSDFPNTFQGCLGNVFVNGEKINLFAFDKGSRTCPHCARSLAEALWLPQFSLFASPLKQDDMFYLPGAFGSLLVPLSGTKRLGVVFSFSTWWQDSVLLVAGTKSAYTVLYSSSGEMVVYTSQLRQMRRIGKLLVRSKWSSLNFTIANGKLLISYPNQSSQTDYEVSTSTSTFDFVSFGGFPVDLPKPDPLPTGTSWLPFSGLLKNMIVTDGTRTIEVDPFAYTKALKVEDPSFIMATETRPFASSCLLGFYGKSSIATFEFTSKPQSLSFTLRTNSGTSELVQLAGPSGSRFFVSLSDRRLSLSSGAETTILDDLVADSQAHTVFIKFENEVTRVYLDGRRVSAVIPVGQFDAAGPFTLTLGAYGLYGCLSNLYYNQRRLDASELTRSDNVDVHRCIILDEERRAARIRQLSTPENITVNFVAPWRPPLTIGGILPFPSITAQTTRRPRRSARTTVATTTTSSSADDMCAQQIDSLTTINSATALGFDGQSSSLTVAVKRLPQSEAFSLKFSFRTTRRRATLVNLADCSVAVYDGVVAISCYQEETVFIEKDASDGKWHELEIEVELNEAGRSVATIKVDESQRTGSWYLNDIFVDDEQENSASHSSYTSFIIGFGGASDSAFAGCIKDIMYLLAPLANYFQDREYIDRVDFTSLYRCNRQPATVTFWSGDVLPLTTVPTRMESLSINMVLGVLRSSATLFSFYNETLRHGLKILVNQSRIEVVTFNSGRQAHRHQFKYSTCGSNGGSANLTIKLYARRMQIGVLVPNSVVQSALERIDIPRNIVAIPYLGGSVSAVDSMMRDETDEPLLGCTSRVQIERSNVPVALETLKTTRGNQLISEYCPFDINAN